MYLQQIADWAKSSLLIVFNKRREKKQSDYIVAQLASFPLSNFKRDTSARQFRLKTRRFPQQLIYFWIIHAYLNAGRNNSAVRRKTRGLHELPAVFCLSRFVLLWKFRRNVAARQVIALTFQVFRAVALLKNITVGKNCYSEIYHHWNMK